ncbi:MAG: response regulator [Thermodesulfobacteriota bacterium]|jgi:two-component system chemotaxis response regulator CheY
MATVLIADDSTVMEAILHYMVERVGHKVVGTAKDGSKAVELYRSLRPDLVALDLFMRGADGLFALKEIKRIRPDAKVIMLVADGQDAEEAEARRNGADGFLRKPFRLQAVTEELARVLG